MRNTPAILLGLRLFMAAMLSQQEESRPVVWAALVDRLVRLYLGTMTTTAPSPEPMVMTMRWVWMRTVTDCTRLLSGHLLAQVGLRIFSVIRPRADRIAEAQLDTEVLCPTCR